MRTVLKQTRFPCLIVAEEHRA